MRHCPYGISGASNFLVPDRRAVVGVGNGSQTINKRAKTAVLGLVEEDQLHGHKHAGTVPTYAGTNANKITAQSGSSFIANIELVIGVPIDDATNGTPRTGATTRENRIGMNYYIKY